MELNNYTVLLADPNAHLRSLLAQQLAPLGCVVLQAESGNAAMEVLNGGQVQLVVTEMYLPTGGDDCLISAIRRTKALQRTRMVALTSHATHADREWAMRAGADAYLLKPTRPERFRYVVGRLATDKGVRTQTRGTATSPITRRDSLDEALDDMEAGKLQRAAAIVFSRAWWDALRPEKQDVYRRRSKKLGVRLRSDTALGVHFVEVRESADAPVSTERSESPYRGA